MPDSDQLSHLPAWRAILVLAALAMLGFGEVRALVDPEGDPQWLARFVIAGICVALAVASARSVWLVRHMRRVLVGFALAIDLWFAGHAGLEDVSVGHAVGLVLIASVAMALVHSVPELVGVVGWALGTGVLAYALAPSPEVAPPLYFGMVLTLLPVLGVLTLSRVRLEQQLVDARAELERRVEERTAELAAEVAVRRAAEDEALRASHAKSRFLANMSHELRTPLNAILGYTELVQDELRARSEADLVDDLERVRTSGGHLLAMIDDVLDLARVEAGQIELVVAPVDVGTALTQLARLVEPMRARRGLALEVDAPAGLMANTDRVRLGQIVLNLLSNALKFTERGEVRVSARPGPGVVEVAVSDTGIGIAEDALPGLFRPFVQVDDAPTRRQGGTGLGLALARELARHLGGDLRASSTLGVGSTFTLTLPA